MTLLVILAKKFLKQYKWHGLTNEIKMNINLTEFIKINNLPKKGEKIVVAMSGGVDSSVTAAILNYAGYEVIGVSMKLYEASKANSSKTCCSGVDIRDAREVAKKLSIKHFIVDYKSRFKQSVIDDFVESYNKGHTPIPCIKCNQTVKFKDLFKVSKELNADALVTGHYVNRIQKNANAEMYRAADLKRDQSYFLFNTTQEQLNFLRFPLGGIKKRETREIALELNLNVADKPDSQDICFVPNGNYASVIKDYKPKSFKEGDILDTQGKVIGKHNGIINFTIGQRKGIGIAHKEPLYVVEIKAKENKIVVGNKSALAIKKIYLKNINLLSKKNNNNFFVKVRSTGRLIKAKAIFNKSECEVNLEENEMGISPGQACVFYSKNKLGYKVLGGGWITKTINKYLST